jgi:exopolyphosphatase/guanosine-5'-triphosphate,3'-diphosphate pyrophosphatase
VTRVLAIDVGTNTVLGAVGARREGELALLADEEHIVGLGRGVDEARALRPDRIAAALSALEALRARGRALGVERVVAAGTSALRDAANRDDFLAPARAILGAEVEVIAGRREAELTFAGAFVGLGPPPARALVVDIGGGSTELVWAEGGAIEHRVSLDVGSVRFFERFLAADPPEPAALAALDALLAASLAPLPSPEGRSLVMLAGTASSTAMLVRGARGPSHGQLVRVEEAAQLAEALARCTAAERRALPGMIAARADVLVAGVRVLVAIARWSGQDRFLVSEGGVRFGLLRAALGV